MSIPENRETPPASELRRVGEGREAEIFSWGEAQVLRLLRDPSAGEWADRQAAAMSAASRSGAPVPAVAAQIRVQGRPGIVMERVDGPPLMTVLARSPWKLFSVARMQGALHARLHGVMAPPALPELRGFLRERIERAEALPQSLAAFSLELLDTLPGGDRLCHGDFHVGNILVGPGGPVVIDWTLAARGDPDGDVGRSVMLIRLGEVPPGTPATIRVGRRFGQGLFLRAYERAYRGHRTVDEAAVGRWEIVNAAARFEERIESEYPALERLIESRMHR